MQDIIWAMFSSNIKSAALFRMIFSTKNFFLALPYNVISRHLWRGWNNAEIRYMSTANLKNGGMHHSSTQPSQIRWGIFVAFHMSSKAYTLALPMSYKFMYSRTSQTCMIRKRAQSLSCEDVQSSGDIHAADKRHDVEHWGPAREIKTLCFAVHQTAPHGFLIRMSWQVNPFFKPLPSSLTGCTMTQCRLSWDQDKEPCEKIRSIKEVKEQWWRDFIMAALV